MLNISQLAKKAIVICVMMTAGFVFANPIFAKDLVFPEPENYVSDFANVISSSTESKLNEELKQFEDDTSNQIFVVSVTDYQGTYLEDYAVKLFEAWGIGQKDRDNGILLLFQPEAPSGSRVRIEVGYGLEGAVTDSIAGRILDNYFMDSYFDKDYDSAVEDTVTELIAATEGEYEGTGDVYIDEAFDWASVGLVLFFVLWSILASTKSWWLGGVIGFIAGIFLGWNWFGILGAIIVPFPLLIVGLIIDFILSKIGISSRARGGTWGGGLSSGGFSGGGGGGFSGGGGGSSGGGGASR